VVIVGSREDDIRRYRNVAGGLGIESPVHFLGRRPVHPLSNLLRQADMLVSPRLKGLNTPMKICSYLDSGTAVSATRLRTHTLILDDRTAYLVDPEPDAMEARVAGAIA
jgi:glycosyltransferase involved in cell wall biosynthesis